MRENKRRRILVELALCLGDHWSSRWFPSFMEPRPNYNIWWCAHQLPAKNPRRGRRSNERGGWKKHKPPVYLNTPVDLGPQTFCGTKSPEFWFCGKSNKMIVAGIPRSSSWSSVRSHKECSKHPGGFCLRLGSSGMAVHLWPSWSIPKCWAESKQTCGMCCFIRCF